MMREADDDIPGPLDDWEWWTEHLARPSRPMAPFLYYGGKGHMARRIVPLLPRGRVYVEPYCGAASLFWHLPEPYPVEVLNDIDGRIINVFRVLQDEALFPRLAHRLFWTPYSRAEFVRAISLLDSPDPVEAAWAFLVVANQGIPGLTHKVSAGCWSRSFTEHKRGMAGNAARWRSRLAILRHWHDRLTRVQLDCRDALEVVRYWDSPETVFYVDPPYVLETRKERRAYRYEATGEHHRQLVELLLHIQGAAVVSGYDHPIYHALDQAGWERHEFPTAAYSAVRHRQSGIRGKGAALAKVPRTEVVWVKPRE